MTGIFLLLTLFAQASALERMIQTEKDFARTSELKGIRDSFLAYLADDGILFRPGPVSGKKWIEEHPPAPGQLTWRPVHADISRAGDLGYTTGPYQYKGNEGIQTGYYFTIWKKQKDGSFRFVLDCGISCPASPNPPAEFFPPAPRPPAQLLSDTAIREAISQILKAEVELAADAAAKGEREALESWSGREIRLYRDGKLPVSARTAMGDLLSATPGTISMKAENANVAASGDFGYSYGSTVLRLPDSPASKTLQFVRIWKKQDNGKWRVAVDILN